MFKRNKPNQTKRSPQLGGNENQVYSYRSARNDHQRQFDREETYEERQSDSVAKIRIKKIFRLVLAVSIMALLIFALSYVSKINQVEISNGGSNREKQQQYTDNLNTQLSQNVLNKNFWLIDQSKMTDELKKSFPEVQDATYNYSIFRHDINVKVVVSQPAFVLESAGNKYLVDSKGRVVDENYSVGGVVVIIDADNVGYKKGDLALTSANLNYIHNIIEQSKAKNIEIEKISLEHGATELFVKYKGNNYFVKFGLANDPRISFGTFIVARDKSGQAPTEYIDVRVPDRAYIK